VLGPINNISKDVQSNTNRLIEQPMSPDFGTNPLPPQPQQQLSNAAGGPLNMPGGNRIPMYSGSPSMGPAMQAGGSLQVPTFDETNQGNPQLRLNSQSQSNTNPAPYTNNLSSGLSQYRPTPQLIETNSMQGPLNNVQDSMNNPQHKYLPSVPSTAQYPQTHYLSSRPFMGQQRPYPPPSYPNSNIYEASAPVTTQGLPGQSYLTNMNMGRYQQLF